MSAVPEWEPADAYTHDLLELVAMGTPATGDGDAEWSLFVDVLTDVARNWGGELDQNVVRPLIRGHVAPKRIGAFWSRAVARDLVAVDGWSTSDDRVGRNSGRPMRKYRWIGGDS